MSTHSVDFTLGTNNSALKTGLDQAKHQVESFKEQTHEMLAGLFAGVGVEQLISKFARVKDIAEMFDTTSEAVQRVSQLSEKFGTNIDTVARSLAKMRSGAGDAFGKLGIDAEAFTHAQMDQQLVMIAQALEKVEDPQQRINLAFEALGPRMKEILPLLNQGSEKIREMMDGFHVASNDTVDQLHAAEQQITGMKNTVTVWAAWLFDMIVNRPMQMAGTTIGTIISIVSNGMSRIINTSSALLKGDFKGAVSEIKANADDLWAALKNGKDQFISALHGKEGGDYGHEDKNHLGEGGEGGGPEEKRLSLAERLKDIEDEHARKQLDTATRLNQLTEERAMLETQIFAASQKDSPLAGKKGEMEDKLVANTKERLSLEDKLKKEQEQAADKAQKERDRAIRDAEKLAEKKKKEKEKADERAMKESFSQREKDLGFVSGIKQVGESGQHLAGVNYTAINAEAVKGIKLQEEMRMYLKTIAEKEYSVEIPDAK